MGRLINSLIPPLPHRQAAGFTLIEMLVALAIFAMLSAAGVMLLRASINTQVAVSARLGDSGGINRLRAMLSRELATAQPRPGRNAQGTLRAAFTGWAGGMSFIHAAAGDAAASPLARVSYTLENGTLVRRSTRALDGGDDLGGGGGAPATLLRDVTAFACRYRGKDGGWADVWTADDAARLPLAVELTITRRGGAALTMRYLVAPDGLAPEGLAGGLT